MTVLTLPGVIAEEVLKNCGRGVTLGSTVFLNSKGLKAVRKPLPGQSTNTKISLLMKIKS
jgi:hypothetical protein